MNPAPVVSKPMVSVAPARRKKSPVKWFVLAGFLLFGGLAVAGYIARKRRAAIIRVTTDKSVTRTISQVVSATGKVQPELEVKIAPEVSGEIVKLGFREGATVRKGELLVAIKPELYQAQVEQQEANLAAARAGAVEAKAQLSKAQDDLAREADLFRKKLVSDSDYTAARTSVEVAQANCDDAQAQIRRTQGSLNQAKDQLTKTVIYSPIDGQVTSLTTEVGERVAGTGSYGGAEIMRVADLSNMEAQVNVNEDDIVNVKVGDKANISIDAFPNRNFTGVVKEIGAAAKVSNQNTQDQVTNFLVKIRILDKGVALRPSMSANADIITKTVSDVVAVPIQSVTVRSKVGAKTIDELAAARQKASASDANKGALTAVDTKQQKEADIADRKALQRGVFVIVGDHVKWMPVETGVQDMNYIEIKSGLKPGAQVVSGSFGVITRVLKDGMRVIVDNPKNRGPSA